MLTRWCDSIHYLFSYKQVHIRCGIHTGNVFVGNLGAPDRFKFGLMGNDYIVDA